MVRGIKATTSVKVDVELLEIVRERKVNFSELVNNLLASYLIKYMGTDEETKKKETDLSGAIAFHTIKLKELQTQRAMLEKEKEDELTKKMEEYDVVIK